MTCRYVLRLQRLVTLHMQLNGVLSAPVLAQHARWCLAHLDECALVASVFDVQFVEILAKGDVHGAYTICDGWPHTPEEDDLGAGCRGFALHDADDDELARQVSFGLPTATACVLEVPVPWAVLGARSAHLYDVLSARR